MKKAVFDPVAHFYDKEQREFTKDIPFYVDYAKKCRGEALELGCGTGRVLIPIAQAGIKITGLDISREMLNIARNKTARLKGKTQRRIMLVQGDMTDFKLNRKFGLIIIAFRSFQSLVSNEAQEKCLACIGRHLKKNGRLVIDLFAPKHEYLARKRVVFDLTKFFDPESRTKISGHVETTYDLARQTLLCTIYYAWIDKNSRRHQRVWKFKLAYLFRREMALLLEKHGFKILNVFGDFKKHPYNYHSGEQIFVARKT